MIHVDRRSVPAPAALAGDTSAGARERQKVLEFYAAAGHRGQAYPGDFSAYKSPEVIAALQQLFRGKCAYCESYYAATQPVDVEHFRPKSGVAAVDGKTGKAVLQRPGYYWLAASWENLLPSCIDCNRERTQEVPGEDPAKLGKANKFPIAGGRYRFAPGSEAREKPLLLDPCADADDPAAHLEFLATGVVRPMLDARRRPSRKGKASIDVYGLQRNGLVQSRRDRASAVLAQVWRVRRLEREVDFADPRTVSTLRDEMAILKGYMEDAGPYAQMARQLIERNYRPGEQGAPDRPLAPLANH